MKYVANCPGCECEFEVAGPATAEAGLQCSVCGEKFTPEKIHKVDRKYQPSIAESPKAISAIEETAKRAANLRARELENDGKKLSQLGALCMFGTIVCIIGGAVSGEYYAGWISIGSGLFALGLVLFVISQLVHIRAELVKQNAK